VAWLYVAKDKYKWRAFVKTAMKLRVIYRLTVELLSCQGFFSKERVS